MSLQKTFILALRECQSRIYYLIPVDVFLVFRVSQDFFSTPQNFSRRGLA